MTNSKMLGRPKAVSNWPAPIPKGLCPPAQGCARRVGAKRRQEARATLGSSAEIIANPEGVVPTARHSHIDVRSSKPRRGTTPLGLNGMSVRVPRVARSSQPWALGLNPFGIPGQLTDSLIH